MSENAPGSEVRGLLTLVDRLEASLLPVVEANTELDLRDGAATEVANAGGRAARGSASGGSGGRRGRSSSSVVRGASGSSGAGTSDGSTLVIDLLDSSEVGLDTEDGIEGISSRAGLSGSSVTGSLSLLASVLGGLVSLARVGQSVADELRDDADSLGRSVVEGSYHDA